MLLLLLLRTKVHQLQHAQEKASQSPAVARKPSKFKEQQQTKQSAHLSLQARPYRHAKVDQVRLGRPTTAKGSPATYVRSYLGMNSGIYTEDAVQYDL